MVVFRWVLLAVVALAASPSQAQVNVPVGRWVIDYGMIRCSLARRLGGEGSPVAIVSAYQGRDEADLILVRDRAALPNLPQRVAIVLQPSGQRHEGQVVRLRRVAGTTQNVQGLSAAFIDAIGASTALRVEASGQTLVELAMPEARQAVAALRACNEDLLRSWQVDPAAAAHYQRRATQTSGSISDMDYPRAAFSAQEQGAVVARFVVSADGIPGNCTIVASSRSTSLDTASCALIISRFRFRGALDARGQPTADVLIRTIVWRM